MAQNVKPKVNSYALIPKSFGRALGELAIAFWVFKKMEILLI
jgi:hypothetical protein